MNSKFQIGIVGCGKIARRHVEACQVSSDVNIAALVDPVVERAEMLASEFGVDTAIVDDLNNVIGNLDGVIIAAPNNLHCRIAVQCAEAGTNVLIEKPIADNAPDSSRICEAHEAAGTVCAVGFVTRFARNNRQMHRLIQSGYFGPIHEFAYQFGSRGGWAPLSAYNLDRKAAGGGVLVVTGSHFIDRMSHWFGEPSDCALWTDSLGGPEANALASFRFAREDGELCGTARFSKTVALPAGIVMRTERGVVSLVDSPDAQIRIRPHDADVILAVEPDGPNESVFLAQLEDFVNACRCKRSPSVRGRDALRSVVLTESLYRSSQPLSQAPRSGRIEEGNSIASDTKVEIGK